MTLLLSHAAYWHQLRPIMQINDTMVAPKVFKIK